MRIAYTYADNIEQYKITTFQLLVTLNDAVIYMIICGILLNIFFLLLCTACIRRSGPIDIHAGACICVSYR